MVSPHSTCSAIKEHRSCKINKKEEKEEEESIYIYISCYLYYDTSILEHIYIN